ncbi:uncharacterized protein DFL_000372 [Arthrobotrys flagrans]|uniref:Uncharacterized protein n=1 Tax=Arthrobotrys flagrans TaxID=97331 RepID=A0A437ADJ5_ARTFL|nr:hypothetical protein DFL_000372 [Arthrobotrys flagrans]
MSSVKISIAVFKGDPLDYTSCRHTGLVLEYDDQQLLLHVKGAHGFFEFEEAVRRKPVEESERLALDGIIHVARIPAKDMDMFRAVVANTNVNNRERGWNCQNFVGDALRKVEEAHLISKEEFDEAIDKMATVLLEATDYEL